MTIMKPLFIAALLTTIATPATAAKLIPASGSPEPVFITTPAQAAPTRVAVSPAHAPQSQPASSVASNTGSYIGAQLGDSSVGLLFGYRLSKMFSMEISYDYVDPRYTYDTIKTIRERTRLIASGLAMFPVKFSDMGPMALYVKVGYGRSSERVTVDDPGLGGLPASTTVTTTNTTGVTGGAGVHVDLSTSTSARLGINVVGSDKTTYLAALYRF